MSPNSNPALHIAVALHSEAAPLIDYYRLKKVQALGVQCYEGEYQQHIVRLLVSGIGRVCMASAVGWLAAHCGSKRTAWLNIGTAGHLSLPVGSAVRVAHCLGEPDGRAHYPPLVASWRGAVGGLQTGDHVCTDYPALSLVDMEGSAFFTSASRFAPAELIQAIKIVSDNKDSGVERLTGASLTSLVANNLNAIAEFAGALLELAANLPRLPALISELDQEVAHLRITVSQLQQLREQLQNLVNAGAQQENLRQQIRTAVDVKPLLLKWRSQAASLAPEIP